MRVVITGAGLLCPAGLGPEVAFEAMLEGRVGMPGTLSDFEPGAYLGERGIRHFDRTALLLASAATAAIDASKLPEGAYEPEEIGIVVGETHGSIQSIADFDQEALREGPRYVNPQSFANTVINAPAGRLAIRLGVTGLNSTLSSGSASALDALAHSLATLSGSQIRAAICGAALGYSSEIELGFQRAGLLGDAAQAEAPFGAKRRGAVLGEGAAVVVLEHESAAETRGAPALAWIAGACTSFAPPEGSTAPHEGLVVAMRGALAQASLRAEDLSLISSGASGSVSGDAIELAAIRALLGEAAGAVPVNAPKSATRECLEASGAIGVVSATSSILSNRIPPVAGLANVDADAAGLDLVIGEARETTVDHVLVTARDEAGHCGAVVVSRA